MSDVNELVLEAPVRWREAEPSKPKTLPPYTVIIENDNEHTFPYVIEILQKVFAYPLAQCDQLTMTVHSQGEAAVWSGPKEVAELKRDQIRGCGPDFHAAKTVHFPLGVRIEPLPG